MIRTSFLKGRQMVSNAMATNKFAFAQMRAFATLDEARFIENQTVPKEDLYYEAEKKKKDQSDDLSVREMISLEEFYSTTIGEEMSDEVALEYMKFAAKLSQLKFNTDQEMLAFKSDFTAALQFINKLDEVDVS